MAWATKLAHPLRRSVTWVTDLKHLAVSLDRSHHVRMRAYSLDLRRKVVEAILRGMPKAEAARSFGIGLSTVKRYVGKAHKGKDLAPRRAPGRRRTLDEGAMRLLESDLKERPALTLSQRRSFLERVVGAQVSESTISRAIKRHGWSRKKIGGCRRTRGVPEGRLEGDGGRKDASESLCVRGRVLHQHFAFSSLRLVA
jgi:transposase